MSHYATLFVVMLDRLTSRIMKRFQKKQRKTLETYKRETLVAVGRTQFQTLLKKKLQLPIGIW